jgi:hypothetical protein
MSRKGRIGNSVKAWSGFSFHENSASGFLRGESLRISPDYQGPAEK